ncbi:unnamed protein product, partial [Musa textilis]
PIAPSPVATTPSSSSLGYRSSRPIALGLTSPEPKVRLVEVADS